MDVKMTSLEAAPARAHRHWAASRRAALTPYLFILPFAMLFTLFFILPIADAIDQSLFRSQHSGLGLGPATVSFDGLGNYASLMPDPSFWSVMGRVLLYGVVQVPVMLILALVLALLLDSPVVRFKRFFRVAYFVPYAIPGIIAALQAIPPDIYESARMDGASGLRIAWSIKIPLVAPALVLTCIFSIMVTVLLFEFVAIWNNYFLPLVMLNDPSLFPITVGLQSWNVTAAIPGNGQTIYNLIVTGALLSSIPLLIGCILLQRFWRGGLGVGSVKG